MLWLKVSSFNLNYPSLRVRRMTEESSSSKCKISQKRLPRNNYSNRYLVKRMGSLVSVNLNRDCPLKKQSKKINVSELGTSKIAMLTFSKKWIQVDVIHLEIGKTIALSYMLNREVQKKQEIIANLQVNFGISDRSEDHHYSKISDQ